MKSPPVDTKEKNFKINGKTKNIKKWFEKASKEMSKFKNMSKDINKFRVKKKRYQKCVKMMKSDEK